MRLPCVVNAGKQSDFLGSPFKANMCHVQKHLCLFNLNTSMYCQFPKIENSSALFFPCLFIQSFIEPKVKSGVSYLNITYIFQKKYRQLAIVNLAST